jgi:SAM-dependent methyltransferase
VQVRESGMPEERVWESFFDPPSLFDALGLNGLDGDVIEFGCGYGTFTVEAARRTTGTLVALDIDADMVARSVRRAAMEGIRNVCIEQRDFVGTGCGRVDGSADYALLFNILHLERPVELLREVYRTLKPGGRAGVIHWKYDRTTPRGPSMEIRPKPEQCRAWAEDAGFERIRDVSLPGCPYHYGLVFHRPG